MTIQPVDKAAMRGMLERSIGPAAALELAAGWQNPLGRPEEPSAPRTTAGRAAVATTEHGVALSRAQKAVTAPEGRRRRVWPRPASLEHLRWKERAYELAQDAIWAGSMERSARERYAYVRFLAFALEDAARRYQDKPLPTVHVFHHPKESIRAELGIGSDNTFRRYLEDWAAAGLVDARDHVTTADLGSGPHRVKDGTVFAVKLDPARNPDQPARLRAHDLKASWRDLEADQAAGRTAHAELQAMKARKSAKSLTPREDASSVNPLVRWSLPPARLQSPLTVTSHSSDAAPELADMLALRHTLRADRNRQVERCGQAIARELQDPDDLMAYCDILWQLLRLHDQGTDRFHAVHQQIRRVVAEIAEGAVKRGGALLTARLKEQGLWDELMATPRVRVGTRPAAVPAGHGVSSP